MIMEPHQRYDACKRYVPCYQVGMQGNLNEIYNIATGQATQMGDIIYKAKEYLNSNSPVKSKKRCFHKVVQAKDCALDASKLNALGFKPEISIDDIVEEYVSIN